MNCPRCSAEISGNWRYCQECGTELPGPSSNASAVADMGAPAAFLQQASPPPQIAARAARFSAVGGEALPHQIANPAARIARQAAYEYLWQTSPLPLHPEWRLLPGGLGLFGDEFLVALGPESGAHQMTVTTYRLILSHGSAQTDQQVIYLTAIRDVHLYKGPFQRAQLVIETFGGRIRLPLPHRAHFPELRRQLLALAQWARQRSLALPTMVAPPLPATFPAPSRSAPPPREGEREESETLKAFKEMGGEKLASAKPNIPGQGLMREKPRLPGALARGPKALEEKPRLPKL